MANQEKTDRFRPVFEPEDIFDRFVKNANASTEPVRAREDEPTGRVEGEEPAKGRGGPPSWDHRITVLDSSAATPVLPAEAGGEDASAPRDADAASPSEEERTTEGPALAPRAAFVSDVLSDDENETTERPSAPPAEPSESLQPRIAEPPISPRIPVPARPTPSVHAAVTVVGPEDADASTSAHTAKTRVGPAAQPAGIHEATTRRAPTGINDQVTRVASSPLASRPAARGATEDISPAAHAPTPVRTVAEEDRGTVRVASPYAVETKSRELPDVDVDEDIATRVAPSPLLGRSPTPGRRDRITARPPARALRPPSRPPDPDVDDRTVPRASPLPSGSLPARTSEPPPLPRRSRPPTLTEPIDDVTDSGQHVLLLTKRKRPSEMPEEPGAREAIVPEASPATELNPVPPPDSEIPALDHDILADLSSTTWKSFVAARGQHTMRIEAEKVVPDVQAARARTEGTAVTEGGEDGQMPTRQLDQILSDMAVLLRYGHEGQVRERLSDLHRTYPEDLLLLRAIAEFYVSHDLREPALDALFFLAGGLFERRNVEGMRGALEQVLVLDPGNERAERLLGLLEKRVDERG
ncbi:MAG: hypothetical protein AB7S26_26600 [Sandaracinaceae bacterium]